MSKHNVHKVGLAFGALFGCIHLAWSLLIMFGWAQGLMDFIFNLHMINPVYVVSAFNVWTALTLIVVTAVIGYILGLVFGWLWNKLVAV